MFRSKAAKPQNSGASTSTETGIESLDELDISDEVHDHPASNIENIAPKHHHFITASANDSAVLRPMTAGSMSELEEMSLGGGTPRAGASHPVPPSAGSSRQNTDDGGASEWARGGLQPRLVAEEPPWPPPIQPQPQHGTPQRQQQRYLSQHQPADVLDEDESEEDGLALPQLESRVATPRAAQPANRNGVSVGNGATWGGSRSNNSDSPTNKAKDGCLVM